MRAGDCLLRFPAILLSPVQPKRWQQRLTAKGKLGRLGQEAKTEPGQLFLTLLEEAKERQEPFVQEALKALLVYYPAGQAAYLKHFPLSPLEQKRLAALAAEQAQDLEAAWKVWAEVGKLYEQAEKRLEAAAVARHLAGLAEKLYGPQDENIERMLQRALKLDSDDLSCWLQLAQWYLKVGDKQSVARLLDDALNRFPNDPKVLELAAEAALERGALKKAARLTANLLKLDPIHQAARQRLLTASLSSVRRQIAAGRLALASRELQAATELAKTPKDLARVSALESALAALEGKADPFARSHPLLPSPGWEFLVVAEILCLAPARARPYLKQLRQILEVAKLKIDQASVVELLDLALEAKAAGTPIPELLRPARSFLRRGATLDWPLKALEGVLERLVHLNQYQLVRDYARASRNWPLPALVYFDVVAKCQGAAADLDLRDLAALEQAIASAEKAGQHRLVSQIAEFLQEYEQVRVASVTPTGLEPWAQEAQLTPREIFTKLFKTLFPRQP